MNKTNTKESAVAQKGLKCLVTGATGFVGGRLAKTLVENGMQVRALIRKTSKTDHLAELGVELAYGDLLDLEGLAESASDVDVIFHIGEIQIREKQSDLKNEQAVKVLCESAGKNRNFKRIVYQSALTVASVPISLPANESTPVNPKKRVNDYHTRIKSLSERALQESGTPASVVRAGAIYGPDATYLLDFVRLCRKIRFPAPFPGLPDSTFATIHVEDLVQVLMKAAFHDKSLFRVFNAVDDNIGSSMEFIRRAVLDAGIDLRFFHPPLWLQRLGAMLIDPLVSFKLPGNNFESIIFYQGFDQKFTNERIRNELGVQLKFPTWDQGMPDTVEWMRKAIQTIENR